MRKKKVAHTVLPDSFFLQLTVLRGQIVFDKQNDPGPEHAAQDFLFHKLLRTLNRSVQ